jgi:Prokaryotic RING finger family 1
MAETIVAANEVGRSCPYCRFPLKAGTSAHQCESCGALHHSDCWQEGAGCSVFGCSGAGTAELALPVFNPTPTVAAGGEQPTVQQPAVPAVPLAQHYSGSPPPAGNGTDPDGHGRSGRTPLIALACVLVLCALGGAAYAVASGGHHTVTTTVTTETPTTSTVPSAQKIVTQTGPSTTAGSAGAASAARDLNNIITQSEAGRSQSVAGNYSEAISDRQQVLQDLSTTPTPTPALHHAVQLLKTAMHNSINADQSMSDGNSAAAGTYNDASTSSKQAFVNAWNPIANQYNLPTYSANQI